MQPFVFSGIFPASPQPAKHERGIVRHPDGIRDFPTQHFLPFVKSIHRNQAAAFHERLPVRWRGIDRFKPRIDRFVRDLGIFGPGGNQGPS
jgi:hypothetical protein